MTHKTSQAVLYHTMLLRGDSELSPFGNANSLLDWLARLRAQLAFSAQDIPTALIQRELQSHFSYFQEQLSLQSHSAETLQRPKLFYLPN